jgi:hypothetical protein
MRKYTDPIVECPFDPAHKMPQPRLQWHLVKCSAKIKREQAGLPIFNCKNNFSHIFLEADKLNEHEIECDRVIESKKKADRALSNTWDGLATTSTAADGNVDDDGWSNSIDQPLDVDAWDMKGGKTRRPQTNLT